MGIQFIALEIIITCAGLDPSRIGPVAYTS